MTAGLHFCYMGFTFSVLGATGAHLWDHPGAPEKATWDYLGAPPEPDTEKTPFFFWKGPVLVCLNHTVTLKSRNCVSTAPARADRGSRLPKPLTN